MSDCLHDFSEKILFNIRDGYNGSGYCFEKGESRCGFSLDCVLSWEIWPERSVLIGFSREEKVIKKRNYFFGRKVSRVLSSEPVFELHDVLAVTMSSGNVLRYSVGKISEG